MANNEKIEYYKFHCMKRGRIFYKKTNTKIIMLAADKKVICILKANYLHDLPMHRQNKTDEKEWNERYSLFMRQLD